MARPSSRFIENLSERDIEYLRSIWKTSASYRARCRAHAILMSYEGATVADIAESFDVIIDTVYGWLKRWENDQELEDAPRSGAPPRLNDAQRKIAEEELEKSPNNPKGAVSRIKQRTGISISLGILRRIAKRAGLTWKRVRGSLRNRRDQERFDQAKQEIGRLAQRTVQPDINLWFFDEANFNLTPPMPYAWTPIGETLEIPMTRSKSEAVLGFLDLENNFHPYMVEGTVDSEIAVTVMDNFASNVSGTNFVVIDNASPHVSNRFQERIPFWESQGVHLYYLPPYSPELNAIEILWRNIKQHWLPLDSYNSFSQLKDRLSTTLSNIGKSFRINFDAFALS